VKATLKNYRQAPRKVRLVADLVRGKSVDEVRTMLTFLPKKAAHQIKKVIESAVANARQQGVQDTDGLIVRDVTVDKGFTFVRYRARSRGRSSPIRKQSSHITLLLGKEAQKSDEKGKGKSKGKSEQATTTSK